MAIPTHEDMIKGQLAECPVSNMFAVDTRLHSFMNKCNPVSTALEDPAATRRRNGAAMMQLLEGR